jgi:hypothetical protein
MFMSVRYNYIERHGKLYKVRRNYLTSKKKSNIGFVIILVIVSNCIKYGYPFYKAIKSVAKNW